MYDAIVVGAGHAGCEACFALAKKGYKTLLITLSLDHIAKMPCNPSIGGPAKGIVVREIDAFGGIMPQVGDQTALQFKLLNSSKGPGVRALRVQSDKIAYSQTMRNKLEALEKLDIVEDQVLDLLIKDHQIYGVKTSTQTYKSKLVILTTGTYMDSKVMISDDVRSEGPDNEKTTKNLSQCLKDLGIELFRLKTGTPPRILKDSIDYSKTTLEPGTDAFYTFSNETEPSDILSFDQQLPCFLTRTTLKTKEIIEANLEKSSMYSGVVTGVGPRYCPSIEDKIVRFNDKMSHQIFLEPESLSLDTVYVAGFSSSMPKDVQEQMLKSIQGLEKAKIVKYAYAIEYDAINPFEIDFNLELRKIKNLFVAGQIIGTSGYEEAAGLGLMAGINAIMRLENKEPVILNRDQAYIGVMIDDLITKGTLEPYRLLTSRAEYRLLLRHDNADQRLSDLAYGLGLISEARYQKYLNKMEALNKAKQDLLTIQINRHGVFDEYLASINQAPLSSGQSLYDLVKRPEVKLAELSKFMTIDIDPTLFEQLEIEIKYEGYINKAKKDALKMHKMSNLKLPQDIDYTKVANLSLEAQSKLNQIRPKNFGMASRISGINPSDLEVIAIYLKGFRNGN